PSPNSCQPRHRSGCSTWSRMLIHTASSTPRPNTTFTNEVPILGTTTSRSPSEAPSRAHPSGTTLNRRRQSAMTPNRSHPPQPFIAQVCPLSHAPPLLAAPNTRSRPSYEMFTPRLTSPGLLRSGNPLPGSGRLPNRDQPVQSSMDGVVDRFCQTEPSSARRKTSNPPPRGARTADTWRNSWSAAPNNSHIGPPPAVPMPAAEPNSPRTPIMSQTRRPIEQH